MPCSCRGMLSGAGIPGRREQIAPTLPRWRQVAPRQYRGGAGFKELRAQYLSRTKCDSTNRAQSARPTTAMSFQAASDAVRRCGVACCGDSRLGFGLRETCWIWPQSIRGAGPLACQLYGFARLTHGNSPPCAMSCEDNALTSQSIAYDLSKQSLLLRLQGMTVVRLQHMRISAASL